MRGALFRTFDTLLDKAVVLSYTRLGNALRQAAWKDADLDVDMTNKVVPCHWRQFRLGPGHRRRPGPPGRNSVYADPE
jgi:hypothetical protein